MQCHSQIREDKYLEYEIRDVRREIHTIFLKNIEINNKISNLNGRDFKFRFLQMEKERKSVENLYEELKINTKLMFSEQNKLNKLIEELIEEMD